MTLDITFHDTTSVTAKSVNGGKHEWAELSITSAQGERHEVTLFFRESGKAAKFAASINLAAAEEAIRGEVERIKADFARMGPRALPAGHTDAFGDQQDYADERAHGWAFEGAQD